MTETARAERPTDEALASGENETKPVAQLRAFILDMDGVVTNTADAHFDCWKAVFDGFLQERSGSGDNLLPFTRLDYLRHVDGIPRHAGIRAFLTSRDIDLPEGRERDETHATIRGIGSLKNQQFHKWLEQQEVPTFSDARALIGALKAVGIKVGIFSSSRNAKRVLESAGVHDLFDAVVTGADAEERNMAAKPDPAMLLETARQLGVHPRQTAVIEDAIAGVEAGSRGRFALVVGVNRQEEGRGAQRHALRAHGADLVVSDLRRLLTEDGSALRSVGKLPSVWDRQDEMVARIGNRSLAAFLDYDGTLTPIVQDYRKADISDEMVQAVEQLAGHFPTAIISGRDLDDVRDRVGLDQVFYAGSHGFDIAGPGGMEERPEGAEDFLQPIEAAEKDVRSAIEDIEGAEIERKTFSIAVHFRNAADEDSERVERAVDDVVGRHEELRRSRGKKVFEIQPRADWDKGNAVEWLLANTKLGQGKALPLYIGDDTTDEDAFAAIEGRGIAIVVRDGERITSADYALEDPEDVRRFLQWLTKRAKEAEP